MIELLVVLGLVAVIIYLIFCGKGKGSSNSYYSSRKSAGSYLKSIGDKCCGSLKRAFK